jgi:phospholipase/lecithinase/hemolysin
LTAISTLASEDARNFLIVNVPDVGLIPEFAQDNSTLASAATSDSVAYDNNLTAGLATFEPTLPAGTSVDEFNLVAYNKTLLANAAALGFTNTTDRCFINTPLSAATTQQCGTDGANINSFVYWDSIHPTERVQAQWAQAMGAELGVNVPVRETSTWAMMLIGFAGLGFAGYRSRRLAC